MRFFAFVVALLTFAAGSAHAQTVTTTDALGETVVEFITIDQNLGLPTTEILQTLTATTTTTTAPDGQQGPVGQPEPTTDDGSPTDQCRPSGDLTAVVDTFTPTFLTTSTWLSAPAGTILDYTAWRSEVGTNTVAPSISAARVRWKVESGWLGIAASLLAGVAGGAWLALA
ncbi:hypothetical protein ACG7TL_007250 [Trametes sanguinea]